MKLEQLSMQSLAIPLRGSFRHAAAERRETETVWVEARTSAVLGCGEGCPRGYVTGEDVASALAFFARHRAALLREIHDLASLERYAAAHTTDIDRNPAAWCAVELALLDALARECGVSVEAMLGLRDVQGAFRYSAVLGIEDRESARRKIAAYRELGFIDFKLKLSGDLGQDRVAVADLLDGARRDLRLRLDANNLWPSRREAVEYLAALRAPAFAIEEPLPAGAHAELARLSDATRLRVILDESCTRAEQLAQLEPPAERWIVNLRVSKLGGVLRSRAVLAQARTRGIACIVGAQVGETSLLTRAGLCIAAQAAPDLLAQEGGFGTMLLTEDVCDPPLQWGAGGMLHMDAELRPGWGLDIAPRKPQS